MVDENTISGRAAHALAQSHEELIKDALKQVNPIDSSVWTNGEIVKRVQFFTKRGLKYLQIDGKDMIEFHPMTHEMIQKDGKYQVKYIVKYRKLY